MFIFLDTETTGTGPDDRLCQIAFKPEGGPAVCETFNPGRPISILVLPSIDYLTFLNKHKNNFYCEKFFNCVSKIRKCSLLNKSK
jgi:hypothetical protein